ncbi:MAG: diacylglycerol kinase family protein [Verrucomicrobiota bacterium]|jgi:diacylglycerol kinase family enzyme
MATSRRIDVIATSISGSVSDWRKVDRIVPLFRKHGEENVQLAVLDSHRDARAKACELARAGSTLLISAGGSGTFNSVVEGCLDAGVELSPLRLGFLRKGSADLIGKVLGMPDNIEEAVAVFVDSIRHDRITPCDILQATSELGQGAARHFVGYGGAEIFGEIPHFTENRFIKYYKGILSELFGDLGPFFVGTNLVILRRLLAPRYRSRRVWEVVVDGQSVARGQFQAMIIVNGDLGPNLPLAKGVPLGSGDFHLFAIRNLGPARLPGQLRAAWNASILQDPARWGLESFRITQSLVLRPGNDEPFPLNTDGSTFECRRSARFRIAGRLNFLSHR